MIKSMVEQLWWNGTLDAPRKTRFSEQYTEDITTLVSNTTSEIINRYGKDARLTSSLNNSLAFFLFDLLSIMDRGFVFGLIRTYYKQMSAKIASLPDAVPLIHYKVRTFTSVFVNFVLFLHVVLILGCIFADNMFARTLHIVESAVWYALYKSDESIESVSVDAFISFDTFSS